MHFLSRWNDYVEATKVTGKDEVLQLLECCDEELRRDVTRMAGGSLTNKTAEEVLAAIRTLAVREDSPMVARAALYAMHQDRDEPVRTFAARARGQARTCQFTQDCPQCSTAVDFTVTMIRDVVTRGLDDLEGSGVAEWARALTGDRTVNGSSPAAVKTFRFASELWQFRLPRLASVFRMRHKKPLVPSIWCLCQGK